MRYVILVMTFFGTLFVVPTAPAHATTNFIFTPPAPAKYVEVTENLPSSWDVKGAAYDVDKYTTTTIKVVSKCSGKVPCVNIRSGKLSGKPIGWFAGGCSLTKYDPCKITVDLAKASRTGQFDSATRRWLVRHEIAHFRGLGHSKSCSSTMYEIQRCNGKVPANNFSSSEKAKLKTM